MSLIFTFVYAHSFDDTYVAGLCELVEGQGGSVDFVQLTCETAVQEQRVTDTSRRGRKLDSVEALRVMSQTHDLSQAIPGRESVLIDTTHLPPSEAAQRIAAELALPLL